MCTGLRDSCLAIRERGIKNRKPEPVLPFTDPYEHPRHPGDRQGCVLQSRYSFKDVSDSLYGVLAVADVEKPVYHKTGRSPLVRGRYEVTSRYELAIMSVWARSVVPISSSGTRWYRYM